MIETVNCQKSNNGSQRQASFNNCFFYVLFFASPAFAQSDITWSQDGNSYFKIEKGELARYDLPSNKRLIVLDKKSLTPAGQSPLQLGGFDYLKGGKVLLFTNTQKVWRFNTRGDYWIFDSISNSLKQLGKDLPAASLMFAKFNHQMQQKWLM